MSAFLPTGASAHAAQIDLVLLLVHLVMAALFVGWAAYLIFVLVRFRQRRQPRADPHGATGRVAFLTEVGVVVAEALLLFVFALPLWFNRTAAEPADANAVVIRVVAEQFMWTAHYPGADGRFGDASIDLVSPENPVGLNRASPSGRDDIVETGRIHVPVGRQVIVRLSSKDVIHSFGVPAMRVKRDAVPGMPATIWFTPIQTGEFDIACSQLCGLGHYRMRGVIVVESEAAFRQFLADEAAAQGK
jgi:cytochrome c oxidase subunit 2